MFELSLLRLMSFFKQGARRAAERCFAPIHGLGHNFSCVKWNRAYTSKDDAICTMALERENLKLAP